MLRNDNEIALKRKEIVVIMMEIVKIVIMKISPFPSVVVM